MQSMTQEEVLEGNKIISSFINVHNEIGDIYYIPEFGEYQNNYGSIEYTETFNSKDLKYNSDWNWLMPCIGKISNECEEPEELDDLKYALLFNDIDTAYKFVVDYLNK